MKYDIPTYSELILGLPGETYESWVAGLEECLSAGIKNNIFIYLCQVLVNTQLADPLYIKMHKIILSRVPVNEGHGAIRLPGVPCEYENVVIGSYSMSVAAWKRAVVISWVLQGFVGLKLAFFILIYLKQNFKVDYVDFLRFVCDLEFSHAAKTVMGKNIIELYKLAESITKGGPHTVIMPEFGDIYWEPEEVLYFNFANFKDKFYDEFPAILKEFLEKRGIKYPEEEIKEVVEYQRMRTPQYYPLKNYQRVFEYNVGSYFDKCFSNKKNKLSKVPQEVYLVQPRDYQNDKKEFARQIVLYGRKGSQSLYQVNYSAVAKRKKPNV